MYISVLGRNAPWKQLMISTMLEKIKTNHNHRDIFVIMQPMNIPWCRSPGPAGMVIMISVTVTRTRRPGPLRGNIGKWKKFSLVAWGELSCLRLSSANWGQIIGYYWIYPILLAIIGYYWLLMAFIGYYLLLFFLQKFSYYWLLLWQAPSLIIAIIGTLLLQLLVPLTIIGIIGYYCLLLILI